jgi:hypothetical protein
MLALDQRAFASLSQHQINATVRAADQILGDCIALPSKQLRNELLELRPGKGSRVWCSSIE